VTVARALLLDDAPAGVVRAVSEAGLLVVSVASAEAGRALLARGASQFAIVDGRIATPLPLDEEIGHRLDAFFDRLRQHEASGLYAAVMREVERPLIAGALARAKGVRAAAAEALGIDRGTLSRRMRALGMEGEET
jgi:Fis family transcriptional regulator, factor for inversion stimulation protein